MGNNDPQIPTGYKNALPNILYAFKNNSEKLAVFFLTRMDRQFETLPISYIEDAVDRNWITFVKIAVETKSSQEPPIIKDIKLPKSEGLQLYSPAGSKGLDGPEEDLQTKLVEYAPGNFPAFYTLVRDGVCFSSVFFETVIENIGIPAHDRRAILEFAITRNLIPPTPNTLKLLFKDRPLFWRLAWAQKTNRKNVLDVILANGSVEDLIAYCVCYDDVPIDVRAAECPQMDRILNYFCSGDWQIIAEHCPVELFPHACKKYKSPDLAKLKISHLDPVRRRLLRFYAQ